MQYKWICLLLTPILLVSVGCSGCSFDLANLPIMGRTITPTPTETPSPIPTSTNPPIPTTTSSPTITITPTITPTFTPRYVPSPTVTPVPQLEWWDEDDMWLMNVTILNITFSENYDRDVMLPADFPMEGYSTRGPWGNYRWYLCQFLKDNFWEFGFEAWGDNRQALYEYLISDWGTVKPYYGLIYPRCPQFAVDWEFIFAEDGSLISAERK